MIEKIEFKRHKLRGYDKSEDQLNPGGCSSYPFTPKNSYVDSSFESAYEHRDKHMTMIENRGGANVLSSIDSDVLMKKLMEKRKGDHHHHHMNSGSGSVVNSSSSSKSQSMTRLPVGSEDFCSGEGPPQLSPQFTVTPPIPTGSVSSGHHHHPEMDSSE